MMDNDKIRVYPDPEEESAIVLKKMSEAYLYVKLCESEGFIPEITFRDEGPLAGFMVRVAGSALAIANLAARFIDLSSANIADEIENFVDKKISEQPIQGFTDQFPKQWRNFSSRVIVDGDKITYKTLGDEATDKEERGLNFIDENGNKWPPINSMIRKRITFLRRTLGKVIEEITKDWRCNDYKHEITENILFNIWLNEIKAIASTDYGTTKKVTEDYIKIIRAKMDEWKDLKDDQG